ncbi:MAG: LapA family protein [Deltaproteobacteria bacterium]|nr:LapA family protein [Deltaproteobacteria bacterium]
MKVIFTVILVLFVMLIIAFSLDNTAPVQLYFFGLIEKITIPTYMLIFFTFLLGVIFTGFMGIIERFRLTRTIARLNKTIRELRRELSAFQQPPVIEETKSAGQQNQP